MASRDCSTSIIKSLKIKWLTSARFIYMCSLWNCTIFSPVSDGFYTPFLCLVLNEVVATVSVCFYRNHHSQALGLWLLLQYKFDVVTALRNTEVRGKKTNGSNKAIIEFSPCKAFFSAPLPILCNSKNPHHHTSLKPFAQASVLILPPSPWPSSFWTDNPVKSLH